MVAMLTLTLSFGYVIVWLTDIVSTQVKPVAQDSPGAEERYIKHNKPTDSVSNQSSIDEYYLLPEHKKDDMDSKSFEYHEMNDLNSAESTPASQRKIDIVTSTEVVVVPGAFFVNPINENDVERLSDLEGDAWGKNKNNSNNQGMHHFSTCKATMFNFVLISFTDIDVEATLSHQSNLGEP